MTSSDDTQRFSDQIRSRVRPDPAAVSVPIYIPALEAPPAGESEFQTLPLSALEPDPDNHRKDLGHRPEHSEEAKKAYRELVDTIRASGRLYAPIKVLPRRDASSKFRIFDGERRWRAALEAGLESVKVLIEAPTDQQLVVQQLVLNLGQERPNPYDIACGIQRALDTGLSRDELRESLGKSPAWMSKHLAALKYQQSIQDLLRSGVVRDLNVARALEKMEPEEREHQLARLTPSGTLLPPPPEKIAPQLSDHPAPEPEKRTKKAKPLDVSPAQAELILENLRRLDPTLFGCIEASEELPDRSRRSVAFRRLFSRVCERISSTEPPSF